MNKLDYELIKNLPNLPGVYAVFNKDCCLYVGSSITLKTRVPQHHKKNQFKENNATHVLWIVCEVEKLLEIEREKIIEFRPILNSIASRGGINKKRVEYKNKSLMSATLHLLNKRTPYTSLENISKCSGLPLFWLQTFAANKCNDPGVNRVETLYEFLTGTTIKLIDIDNIRSIRLDENGKAKLNLFSEL